MIQEMVMSKRKPLSQIIERVPFVKKGKTLDYVQDTINLEESIRDENREDTVKLYYFAKTLKQAFEEILVAFSEPIGRGFWLTAEYGVGKSHFLATLACLLSDSSNQVWNCVHDNDIRNYQFQFKKRRLFPVVAGLRGKTAIAQDKPITLLDQLEREIEESIEQLGLSEKINITPVAEMLAMFDKFDQSLQGAIKLYIQQTSSEKPQDLRKTDPKRFADLVRKYFKKSNIPLEMKYSINDRLAYLYRQIVNEETGFNGLLFIIDEFESWLSQRSITSPEGMFDSNVLQALTEILPKQHSADIYTVVASQTAIPAQLQGRFRSLPLLAGSGAERDYHVICAHRVRKYKPNMEVEAKLYYHDFYNEFGCYKSETETSFLETFPFHPLSYEIVRRFTSSVQDMPGVRLGLNIFYDVMKSKEALSSDKPIIASGVYLNSLNFQNSFASPRFSTTRQRYLESLAFLPKIFSEDKEDRRLAEAVLNILYLQYVISGTQAVPMTPSELADATLTETSAITGEQHIIMLLGEMSHIIPQLDYDISHPERGARFIPKQTGPTPQFIFDGLKTEFLGQETELIKLWERLLFAPITQTRGQKAQFSGFLLDKPWQDEVVANQVTYKGELLVVNSWRPDLGGAIQDPYVNFRLIYLLNENSSVQNDLKDPRIVVVEASPFDTHLKELCAVYLAAEKMMEDYGPSSQKGPDAADFHSYAEKRYMDALTKLIQRQLEPFQKGRAITRDQINLDVLGAFSKPTQDQRHSAILRPTLQKAYSEFEKRFSVDKIEKPIVQADARNLVLGLIQGDTTKAVRSTLEQKAVGLGLAQTDDPKQLAPQTSAFFQELDQRLQKSAALSLWPLLKEMAGYPIGIPPYLCASLLLVYVRYRNTPSPVEIQLNPQHTISTMSGQRLSVNRITRANVVDVRWQTDIEKYFDSLVAVSGPDWNAMQPFAKMIYPDAKITLSPQDIDIQIESFLKYLKMQLPLLRNTIEGISTLAKSINGEIAPEDNLLMKKFEDLYSSTDLEMFSERIKVLGADYPKFKESFERLSLVKELASKGNQIIDVYRQVSAADVGKNEDLRIKKELLLPRFAFDSFIGNPTLIAAVISDSEEFIRKFNNAKEVHAKRALDELRAIKERFSSCQNIMSGLGNLNTLEMLGPPQGHDLADRLEKLVQEVEAEISGRSKRHAELPYVPPQEEFDEIQREISVSFENRVRILRSQLEKAIRGSDKGDDIKTLLQLIQVSKLSEVSKNLSPAILETIRKILEKAQTLVVRSYALEQITKQFAAIGPEELDIFLAEIRRLIEKDFKAEEKEGKKVILSFK
jgi:hypothetical protein